MEDKNAGLRTVAYYFGLAMVFVYIVFGILLIVTNTLQELIPGNKRIPLSIIVISYGIFRLYMTLRLTKKRNVE